MSENEGPHYIDSHVHIWSNDRKRYRLGAAFKSEDITPAAYSPEEIIGQARTSGVDRVVLVQINFYDFDNSYMLEAIERFPQVFRGVAVVNGKSEAPDSEMHRLSKLGIRGVRIHPEEATPSILAGKGFEKIFRFAAKERLVVCFLINPTSLGAVDRQCQRFSDTPIVIDHLARIGMQGVIHEPDVRALCALAKYQQVRVKLSGFYALGHAKPPHLDLAFLVKRVYEAFGPRRLMWGSDCPFSLAHETYDEAMSLLCHGLDCIPGEDKNWILGRTAAELFFE